MSSHSYSYSSSISFSYSSSSSTSNGRQAQGQAYQQTRSSNPAGTTIQTRAQRLGEPLVYETRRFDANGNQILDDGRTLGYGSVGGNGDMDTRRRIEDVSDDQKGKDRMYQKRMDDESANRGSGA